MAIVSALMLTFQTMIFLLLLRSKNLEMELGKCNLIRTSFGIYQQGLSLCHQALPIYDHELFVILFAIKKCHLYLVGSHSSLEKNHQSLKHLLEKKPTILSQHTWLAKLMVMKQGKNNKVAYSLFKVYSLNVVISATNVILLILMKQQRILD